jgi:hypothetical protein
MGALLCPICSDSSIGFMFIVPGLLSSKRIGPHNKDVLAFFVGALLGDAYGETLKNKVAGSRICFQQEGRNMEYLYWLHFFLSSRGYCSSVLPKAVERVGISGKIRRVIRFKTFSFTSFNWLIDTFYPQGGIKVLPDFLAEYFSPLS